MRMRLNLKWYIQLPVSLGEVETRFLRLPNLSLPGRANQDNKICVGTPCVSFEPAEPAVLVTAVFLNLDFRKPLGAGTSRFAG